MQIHKKPGGIHRALFLLLRFNFYVLPNNEYEYDDEDDYWLQIIIVLVVVLVLGIGTNTEKRCRSLQSDGASPENRDPQGATIRPRRPCAA